MDTPEVVNRPKVDRSYLPWPERLPFGFLHFHSQDLFREGGLARPNLTVVEFAAGTPDSYMERAKTIVRSGGRYYAFDIDSRNTVGGVRRVHSDRIHIQTRDVNDIIASEEESIADVILISSLNAQATCTLGKARAMRAELQKRLSETNDVTKKTYYERSIQFLTKKLRLDSDGLDDNVVAWEYRNTLALVNALLMLKESGRIVYSQNDTTGSNGHISAVAGYLGELGFTATMTRPFEKPYDIKGGIVRDPAHLLLETPQTRLPLVIAEKDTQRLTRIAS